MLGKVFQLGDESQESQISATTFDTLARHIPHNYLEVTNNPPSYDSSLSINAGVKKLLAKCEI